MPSLCKCNASTTGQWSLAKRLIEIVTEMAADDGKREDELQAAERDLEENQKELTAAEEKVRGLQKRRGELQDRIKELKGRKEGQKENDGSASTGAEANGVSGRSRSRDKLEEPKGLLEPAEERKRSRSRSGSGSVDRDESPRESHASYEGLSQASRSRGGSQASRASGQSGQKSNQGEELKEEAKDNGDTGEAGKKDEGGDKKVDPLGDFFNSRPEFDEKADAREKRRERSISLRRPGDRNRDDKKSDKDRKDRTRSRSKDRRRSKDRERRDERGRGDDRDKGGRSSDHKAAKKPEPEELDKWCEKLKLDEKVRKIMYNMAAADIEELMKREHEITKADNPTAMAVARIRQIEKDNGRSLFPQPRSGEKTVLSERDDGRKASGRGRTPPRKRSRDDRGGRGRDDRGRDHKSSGGGRDDRGGRNDRSRKGDRGGRDDRRDRDQGRGGDRGSHQDRDRRGGGGDRRDDKGGRSRR